MCQRRILPGNFAQDPHGADIARLRLDGHEAVVAEDDHPDAVNRRLDLYETQTAPLINHYSKMGLMAVVNGVGHPDHVFKRVCDAVDERR